MDNAYKIDAFEITGASRRTFKLEISPPMKSGKDDEFFCEVDISNITGGKRKIFGADKRQAIDLAYDFARRMVMGKNIVDEKGNVVSI